MVGILSETEKVRVSRIQPDLIHIVFPPLVTIRGIDDYYRTLLEILRLQPSGCRMLADMTGVKKVQLGAPIEASKWLPKTKKFSSRVAVYGLQSWMQNMLKAVLKISLREDIKVFHTLAEAELWLNR